MFFSKQRNHKHLTRHNHFLPALFAKSLFDPIGD